MVTYKFEIEFSKQDDYNVIDEYQIQYSSCLHVFYRILSKEDKLKSEFDYLANNSIMKQTLDTLNNVELMQSNTWIYRCCIKDALQLYKTNKHVVFGGKKNLERRKKGLISKEEWKEYRKSSILSVGTAKPYKGNQKFEILSNLQTIRFKPTRNQHIDFKLKNVTRKRIQLLTKLFNLQNSKKYPITYKLSKNYVWISIDEKYLYDNIVDIQKINNRVMSIDMNPNYIGYSIVDWKSSSKFNIIKIGCISFKNINDEWFKLNKHRSKLNKLKRKYITNKLEYETYQVCKELIKIARYYKVQLFGIEDLKFTHKKQLKKKSKKKKNLNTLCQNLWFRHKLVQNLTKKCNINNIKILKVQAQYSSIYGNLVYRSLNLPDPVLASIEIGRRTYEFYNQYVIKSKEQIKNIIQPTVNDFKRFYIKALEEFNINDENIATWYDLYDYIKNTLNCWKRVSLNEINNLKFCRCFSQKSLLVNITNISL